MEIAGDDGRGGVGAEFVAKSKERDADARRPYGTIRSLQKRCGVEMRLLPFALLGALLPAYASAQTAGMNSTQRCEQNSQSCVRACFGRKNLCIG